MALGNPCRFVLPRPEADSVELQQVRVLELGPDRPSRIRGKVHLLGKRVQALLLEEWSHAPHGSSRGV